MTSRHAGTIRGAGLSERSYDAIRRDYVIVGDGERERAVQPAPRQIVAGIRAEIARLSPEHARLVAAYERLQARRERQS